MGFGLGLKEEERLLIVKLARESSARVQKGDPLARFNLQLVREQLEQRQQRLQLVCHVARADVGLVNDSLAIIADAQKRAGR